MNEVSLAQIVFFAIPAQLMRVSFDRSNLPAEHLSKYKHLTLRLNVSLDIAVTERY